MGEDDSAQQLLTEALSISREIGSVRSQALVENALGELHLEQGRLDQAEHAFRQATASPAHAITERVLSAISQLRGTALPRRQVPWPAAPASSSAVASRSGRPARSSLSPTPAGRQNTTTAPTRRRWVPGS
jgi:hypothetical protein